MTSGGPRLLRTLAALLIRGPEAPFVRADIDDAFERDVARGLGTARAWWRYLSNVLLSAGNMTRARLHRPRVFASWIDVRLAMRMLVKHPVLTGAAVFALAIGVPVGLAPIHVASVMEGRLPEDPAGRLHVLRYSNASTTVEDLEQWREALTAFDGLAAVRPGIYNFEYHGDVALSGAEVTASAFELLGREPLIGRRFDARDEVPGAPAVAIVSHDLWRSRLGNQGDLSSLSVRIAGIPHRIVGVMPEGFLFPQRQQVWLPARDRAGVSPHDARPLTIFGRLAAGVTPDAADAELVSIAGIVPGRAEASARLMPEVVPMASMAFGLPKGGLRATPEYAVAQLLMLVPLLIACVNVGLLVFARTATRVSEFAVRSALGASRGRILMQVFTESLVLCLVATGVGLWLLNWLPARVLAMAEIPLPYWMDTSLSWTTIAYGLMLGVASAALAGVVPVMRSTGRGIQRAMQESRASRSGERFGGKSSVLIVADVAVAVAVIGFAAAVWQQIARPVGDGLQADRYLSVELRRAPIDGRLVDPAGPARALSALIDRLETEPGVRAVAVGSALPRMDHPTRRIELAGGDPLRQRVRIADIVPGFFESFDQSVLLGRSFTDADLRGGSRAIIVNTSFVANVLGGGNPIGRQLRLLAADRTPEGDWYEIVGVVGHLGMRAINADLDEGIYRPMPPESLPRVRMALEIGRDPMTFAPRLREIVSEVDGQMVVSSLSPLDQQVEGDWYVLAGIAVGGFVFVGVLLALAASSIYAIMSFAVAQRTREIGIRVALGADRAQVVWHVARRALLQIGIGVALGMLLAGTIFFQLQRESDVSNSPWFAIAVALLPGIAVLCVVSLAACGAPTLRALRISPVDALRGGQ